MGAVTSSQRRQRQVVPISHGLYVRTQNGRQLRDRSVQRLVGKLRGVLALEDADVPTARAWCEVEILARLVFAELRATGLVTGQGEPRRLLAEYRGLRATQLTYARELGLTPASRHALGATRAAPSMGLHEYLQLKERERARSTS